MLLQNIKPHQYPLGSLGFSFESDLPGHATSFGLFSYLLRLMETYSIPYIPIIQVNTFRTVHFVPPSHSKTFIIMPMLPYMVIKVFTRYNNGGVAGVYLRVHFIP